MKEYLKAALVLTLLPALGLVSTGARADFQEQLWPYYRGISAPSEAPEGFMAVVVDAGVYAHAQRGLPDLRVIGPAGEEIPYIIIIPQGKVERKTYRPEILNRALKEGERKEGDAPYVVIIPRDAKGRVIGDAAVVDQPQAKGAWQEFVVDFGKSGQKNNRLELLVSDRNFKRNVRIYGSDDAKDWRLLKDGINIFDYSGDVHVKETTLNYPVNVFQYLKIEIKMKDDEEPLNVRGVEITHTEIEPPVETEYDPIQLGFNENPEQKSTDVVVDLGGRNIPVKRLVMEISDPEFYREVRIMDHEFKKIIRKGTIYKYTADGYINERLSLDMGEIELGKFGLRIVNHDNRPLKVEKITAIGTVRAVVFRPPEAGGARLYFGNPEASKPIYDLAQLYPKVTRVLPPMGELEAETLNPLYKPPSPPPRDYSWMIWPVLVLAVVIMGYLIFRHAGQIKNQEP